MKTALKLKALPKGLPKAKAPKPKKAVHVKRKVWTGAKKKFSVSPLQLALPGMGGTPL